MDGMKLDLVGRLLGLAPMLVLLSACHTSSSPGPDQNGTPSPALDRERFQIETAVYRHLFGLSFWSQRRYSAVFVQGDEQRVRRFMAEFPGQVPPIKPTAVAELRPHSTPVDTTTGQPAVLLVATASDPEGDQAGAVGTYYAGAMIRGKFFYTLKSQGGTWVIETVKEIKNPVDTRDEE
jgi:hypothetical protein